MQRAFAATSVGRRDVNPLLRNKLVVHAKYDSHFVPRPIPYYRALSTINYPVLERVRVPTPRTGIGVSKPDGGQTVICGMMFCISAYLRDLLSKTPLGCRFSIRVPNQLR